jgi:O-antigen polymerase
MRRINPFVLVSISIFAGSVFLTSGKFVNETNSIKYYFVIVGLLFTTGVVAVVGKNISGSSLKSPKLYWGILAACFFQAIYGLVQFFGWLPTNNAEFSVTGSFDNPAGFSAVLAMVFPIGLFLIFRSKTFLRLLLIITLMVIGIAILLSGSRTGILAVLLLTFTFFIFQTTIIEKFRRMRFYKLLTVLVMCFFVSTVIILLYQKKDSANGRLLIWKVTSKMIKDKPVFGHGINTFQAKYMDYQAQYFKNNPDSKYQLLADNVKHPFNEFLKVAVEFGFLGLIIIFSLILFVVLRIIKSKNENRAVALSGLVSLFVFASFSYPLQYVATWLFLVFYLSVLLPSQEIKIRNNQISVVMRSIILIVCVYSTINVYKQINLELAWKESAMNSLNGKTEAMLPEYKKLHNTHLKRNPFFLYNYGAELNFAGKYCESIDILLECRELFNDYDLQLILADNYQKTNNITKALETYRNASYMIPARFLPFFRIFEIYKETGQNDLAQQWAEKILNKQVKIPSVTVSYIQNEAKSFLNIL